jgi:uncharacterized protein with von Willebrand factor type A (vWA) domain
MMAFSEIRSRIRGIKHNRHKEFLGPISTNQLLAAKAGTLEQEFQALCKIFGDAELGIAQAQAAELAALREKLRRARYSARRSRRRRPQRC